jgi:DNA-binding NtrC family response regulator
MDLLPPTTTLAEVERAHILRTLRLCEGNRTRTAKVLDVSIRGLRNKLRDYRTDGHYVPEVHVAGQMN